MPFRLSAASVAILLAALFTLPAANAGLFIDSAGRRVILPNTIERIMPAGPASAVFIYVIVPDKLIGWSAPLTRAQRALLPSKYARLPVTGELGGAYPTATAADVLRLHPDLIIGYGVISPPTIALANRIQQQTHIPYILLDDSLQVMPAIVRQLSPILGAGNRGLNVGTYAPLNVGTYIFQAVDILRGQLLISSADDRPRVYYGRGPDGLETPLPGSPSASNIEQMGVINVAGALGRGAIVPVTREQILAWNPQIIIAQQRSFYNALLHNRQWRDLAAVRSKKVYLAPADPFGWIDDPPGLNRAIGLYWLSSLFYPDIYQQDLRTIAREFYQLFYGVQLNDRQLNALLGPAENPAAASKAVANVPIFGAEPTPLPNTGAPGAGMAPPPAGPPGRRGAQPPMQAPPAPNLPNLPNPP
jgi:iron complex transport system substrate-binding protein